jgi:ATP synthase protein I
MDVTVGRVILWQFIVGAAISATFWLGLNLVAAYSAALGGLTAALPNAFLALRLVVPRRDPGAAELIRAAWVGEIGKLALTVVLFTLAFTLVRPLSAAALFVTFIAVQLVTFSGLLMRSETDTSIKHVE